MFNLYIHEQPDKTIQIVILYINTEGDKIEKRRIYNPE